ncbi:MAG: CsgG/HfaB family protein [Elusimicrobiota bacterium]
MIKKVIIFFLCFSFSYRLYSQSVPSLPTLSSPGDGETINITNPVLKWSAVENADVYNVVIYSDKDCTNKITESKPYPKEPLWKMPFKVLEKGKTYYWQVVAHNFDGWSKPSSVWTFTIAGDSEKPIKQQSDIKTEKLNIAVADFSGKNVSAADASIVADFLRTELVNIGTYDVIEKANMDKILAEAAFQQAGCTTSECAVQIGKILNVQKMIVGSLSKLEGIYYITVSIVNVETGKIDASQTAQCESSKELMSASQSLANQLVGNKATTYRPAVRDTRQKQETVASKTTLGLPLDYQTGHIVSTDGKEATIDLGYLHGVRKYQQFSLLKGEERINPATGEKIMASARKVGWLVIDELTDEGWASKGKIASLKGGVNANEGDIVKLRKENGYLSVETSMNKEGVEEFKAELDWKFPFWLRINTGFNNTLFMSTFAPLFYTRLSLDWKNFEIGIGPAVSQGAFGFASILRLGAYDGVFNLIGRTYVCFGNKHEYLFPYSHFGYTHNYYYYDDFIVLSEGEMNIKPSDKVLVYFKSAIHVGSKYTDDKGYQYNTLEARYLPCLGLKIGLSETVNLDLKGGAGIYSGKYEIPGYIYNSIDFTTTYLGVGLEFLGRRCTHGLNLEMERNADTGNSLVNGRYKIKYKF